MAVTGPNYPASGASLANAGTSENANAWANPGNVGSTSAVASITASTFDSPDISEILVASGFGFAFDTALTVVGIKVEISKRGYTRANSGKDFRVQLSTGTTFAGLVGTNKASANVWPATTLATTTYGGVLDTWSAGLTAAQVNATGFAVFVSAYANVANADIDVDWIRVTVTTQATVPASFTANAVIKATVTPAAGFKADARLGHWSTFTIDAATEVFGDYSETWSNLWGTPAVTGSFAANAVITKTQVPAGGTKADAVIKKEMSGSAWTVDAVIRKTFEPSFTANAAILKTWATASQTFTANAAILKTLSPTGFTLDAIFLVSSGTRTFASDAVILAPSDTRTFAANAVISKTQVGSYLADAIRLATQSLTFLIGDAVDPGGAVIVVAQQTVEGSFTANAVLLKLGAGGLTAGAVITRTFTPTGYLSDAVIRREQAGSFAANAVVSKSQTGSLAVNAVTRKAVTGSLTSDAIRLRTFYFGSGPDPR
jgi:hypothetical protein